MPLYFNVTLRALTKLQNRGILRSLTQTVFQKKKAGNVQSKTFNG